MTCMIALENDTRHITAESAIVSNIGEKHFSNTATVLLGIKFFRNTGEKKAVTYNRSQAVRLLSTGSYAWRKHHLCSQRTHKAKSEPWSIWLTQRLSTQPQELLKGIATSSKKRLYTSVEIQQPCYFFCLLMQVCKPAAQYFVTKGV